MSSTTAVLLAAHGSRRDPSANDLVRRLARTLAARGVADEVVPAFHQGVPGFTEAVRGLRADRVVVVPLFTSEGHYTEVVLPAALESGRRPGQLVRQTAPIGVQQEVPALIEARVRAVLAANALESATAAVLAVGHGTVRHRASRNATLTLVEQLRRTGLAARVEAAFLDDQPDIESAVRELSGHPLIVVPFLLGGGRHAGADLPHRLGLDPNSAGTPDAGQHIVLDIPLGEYPELPDLLEQVVRGAVPAIPSLSPLSPLPPGSVALVGAGPGDPGLITVKGLALLRAADVILYDRLVAPELLAEVRAGALLVDVGKLPGRGGASQEAISALLVEHARRGRRVVRLKGGDPYVFGRGSEELDACEAHAIPCTVVSGVTSAIAAPASAGIPLTARGESRSFAVITAQGEGGARPEALARLAANPEIETLVLLMGRSVLPELTALLIASGRDPDTPAASIQEGTTPRQRTVVATLGTLAEAVEREGLESPMVTVIGRVAARGAGALAC